MGVFFLQIFKIETFINVNGNKELLHLLTLPPMMNMKFGAGAALCYSSGFTKIMRLFMARLRLSNTGVER
jgi:hypothetical protein